MDFASAVSFASACWDNRHVTPPPTILFLGPPGIGKTTAAYNLARHMGENAFVEVLDLTSMLPEDINGLPYRENGVTRYSPQAWAARCAAPGACGVLVFDDLPAASPAVAAAVRQVVLERRVRDQPLSSDVLVMVTGNRREDAAGASVLPSHFRNAVCIVEMTVDADGWGKWFLQNGGDPLVYGFLRWKPSMLSMLPKEADKKGSFATPRSWAMLSRHLPAARTAGCVSEMVSGFVGEGVAGELSTYLASVDGLPPIRDIFNDPKGTVPTPEDFADSPDRMMAIVTGLSHLTAMETNKSRMRQGAPYRMSEDDYTLALAAQGFTALGWIVQKRFEYMATAIHTYDAAGGHPDVLPALMRREMLPPEVLATWKNIGQALR